MAWTHKIVAYIREQPTSPADEVDMGFIDIGCNCGGKHPIKLTASPYGFRRHAMAVPLTEPERPAEPIPDDEITPEL
jgi:hypothetical protein